MRTLNTARCGVANAPKSVAFSRRTQPTTTTIKATSSSSTIPSSSTLPAAFSLSLPRLARPTTRVRQSRRCRVVSAAAAASPNALNVRLTPPGLAHSSPTVVYKFGGSSVADATRMREVADIVCSFPEHLPVIVLSAMGKVR